MNAPTRRLLTAQLAPHAHTAAGEPLNRTRQHVWRGWWLASLLTIGMAASPHAAESSAASAAALKVLNMPVTGAPASARPSPSAAVSASRHTVTVKKGESIDAVLRRGLQDLPLKESLLRQALAKANPKIFPRGRTYPVKPGTVLNMPTHEELRQMALAQSPAAAGFFGPTDAAPNGAYSDADLKKRSWVRFP